MKLNFTKKISAGICLALLAGTLSGCGSPSHSANLMDNISESAENISSEAPTPSPNELDADNSTYTDFAVRLFQESFDSERNTLISPLSVINALAMTANGARGETLSQMEQVFGADITSLSQYLYTYNDSLPSEEKYKLHLANSIWLKDDARLEMEDLFLQTNANLFDADIFKSPFDQDTLTDINNWVSDNTDDMISEILDDISGDTVMYLINALTFDAMWHSPYESFSVRNDIFTTESGTEKEIEMMYSEEHALIQDIDENYQIKAQGFMKYYADRRYALVTLLPEEGVRLEDYAQTLSGEKLCKILSDVSEDYVKAGLPKFETEYSTEMSDIFISLGMTDAFDVNLADFTAMGTYPDKNIYIGRIVHKTYITVDEQGTKAGAVTIVETDANGAMETPESVPIILDRPFLYMIIDCKNNLPVFIGSVLEP